MVETVLAAIAGLGGAIGTTVAAGFACHGRPELVTLGRVTASPQISSLHLDLPNLDQIVLTGWDSKQQNLSELANHYGICSDSVLAYAQPALAALIPRKAFHAPSASLGSWISREAAFLRELARKTQASTTVLVNLCPTEPLSGQKDDSTVPWRNLRELNRAEPGVTTSRIYFRLAIEAGAHFINFTPNLAETPSLLRLASENGLCFSGRDGKTGQTFIKTVLAPALRDRNLQIDGWFSTNLLGNADGQALSSPDAQATKKVSKLTCLAEILGYHPGGSPDSDCHQVHIHYYPPRGDAKEAWDNIDFTGFLGGKMQLKLNFLARDSILAAPAVIDLVLLTTRASQRGHTGHLASLGYFYKSPIQVPAEHATSQQFTILLEFLRSLAQPQVHDETMSEGRERATIPAVPPRPEEA